MASVINVQTSLGGGLQIDWILHNLNEHVKNN